MADDSEAKALHAKISKVAAAAKKSHQSPLKRTLSAPIPLAATAKTGGGDDAPVEKKAKTKATAAMAAVTPSLTPLEAMRAAKKKATDFMEDQTDIGLTHQEIMLRGLELLNDFVDAHHTWRGTQEPDGDTEYPILQYAVNTVNDRLELLMG